MVEQTTVSDLSDRIKKLNRRIRQLLEKNSRLKERIEKLEGLKSTPVPKKKITKKKARTKSK